MRKRECDDQDDWETTGAKEMEKLFLKCRQDNTQGCATQLRDRIDQLHSLVEICTIALTHQDWKGQMHVQACVADVLCDYVSPELERIEEELKCL